ncbi:hypothetical protein [Streptomyces sp. NPDC048473]|uniref:hypothetical protein n=1 Tax=unclassified Streptomyces TaxID=2593676 RepID=UPI0037186529
MAGTRWLKSHLRQRLPVSIQQLVGNVLAEAARDRPAGLQCGRDVPLQHVRGISEPHLGNRCAVQAGGRRTVSEAGSEQYHRPGPERVVQQSRTGYARVRA